MSRLSRTHALRGLVDSDSTWRLLRVENAPVISELLSEHLGGETRRRPSAELYQLIDHGLEELRAHGVDLPERARPEGNVRLEQERIPWAVALEVPVAAYV